MGYVTCRGPNPSRKCGMAFNNTLRITCPANGKYGYTDATEPRTGSTMQADQWYSPCLESCRTRWIVVTGIGDSRDGGAFSKVGPRLVQLRFGVFATQSVHTKTLIFYDYVSSPARFIAPTPGIWRIS